MIIKLFWKIIAGGAFARARACVYVCVSFWAFFDLFTPIAGEKIKSSKKKQKNKTGYLANRNSYLHT